MDRHDDASVSTHERAGEIAAQLESAGVTTRDAAEALSSEERVRTIGTDPIDEPEAWEQALGRLDAATP